MISAPAKFVPPWADPRWGTEFDPRWTTCRCAEPDEVKCACCNPPKFECIGCGNMTIDDGVGLPGPKDWSPSSYFPTNRGPHFEEKR